MPRPISPISNNLKVNNNYQKYYENSKNNIQAHQTDEWKMRKMLTQKRSPQYMNVMRNLDAGGHVHNQQKINKMIQAIREEFPEVELEGILLGIVALCYLGKPYEVHTLDLTGEIITHYKAGHPMPGGLEKARTLAVRGGYAFVEVYTDCCRAISSNGTVAEIKI